MSNIVRLAAPVSEQDYIRGLADAPVTILEYADYECPYSARAYFTLKHLQEDMDGTFRLAFRNFPLTQIRPHALPAALAAEAAGMQDAFWQMHDILYEHQDGLEPEHLLVYAQVLGLDIEQFIIDMTSDEVAAMVREDFISGIRSGVNGTPTLYINDVRYDGAYDYESLKNAIEKAEKRTRGAKSKRAGSTAHR